MRVLWLLNYALHFPTTSLYLARSVLFAYLHIVVCVGLLSFLGACVHYVCF